MATTESASPKPASGPPGDTDQSVDVSDRDDVQKLKPHALGLTGVLFIALAGAAPMSAMLGNVPIAVGSGNGTAAPGGLYLPPSCSLCFPWASGHGSPVHHCGRFLQFHQPRTRPSPRHGGGLVGHGRLLGLRGGGVGDIRLLHPQHDRPVPAHKPAVALLRLLRAALVGFLTYFDVRISARILGVALVCEALLLLIMDLFILGKGGAHGVSFSPLNPVAALSGANIKVAAPGVGIFFALWSWVGFECTANYAEEARNPRKMVPRATYIAVLSLGVLFTLTAWSVILGHGLKNAASDAYSNAGTFFFGVTGHFVSPLAKDVMEWLIITSTFACAMAFHAAATRYFYAMGREKILNPWLGKTHMRWQSPYAGSFFQSGVAAVLIALFLIMWYVSKATQNFANFQTPPTWSSMAGCRSWGPSGSL